MRDLVVDLAERLRARVLPALGAHAGRAHVGGGEGRDVTFAIDEEAEREVEAMVAERAPGVAVYTEDRGLVEPEGGPAEWVLVVDPIDGTRPAMAGLEAACVSVALARASGGEPRMGDVETGCVVEIKPGHRFLAQRGAGCEATAPVAPSANVDLGRMFWAYGLRGRPARAYAEVLGDLLDGSSTGGGTFDLGAATFDATRVITGQLDAYVEPGPLLVDRVPGMRQEFERVGRGAVLNNAPYDLAAAALCAQEAGAVVTDAAGASLDDRLLLGSGPAFQMSVIVAGNRLLHSRLVDAIDEGVERLRRSMAS